MSNLIIGGKVIINKALNKSHGLWITNDTEIDSNTSGKFSALSLKSLFSLDIFCTFIPIT